MTELEKVLIRIYKRREYYKKYSMDYEVHSYQTNPRLMSEFRVFGESDFEYIQSMANKDFPSIQQHKQKEMQIKNIKSKYENL